MRSRMAVPRLLLLPALARAALQMPSLDCFVARPQSVQLALLRLLLGLTKVCQLTCKDFTTSEGNMKLKVYKSTKCINTIM